MCGDNKPIGFICRDGIIEDAEHSPTHDRLDEFEFINPADYWKLRHYLKIEYYSQYPDSLFIAWKDERDLFDKNKRIEFQGRPSEFDKYMFELPNKGRYNFVEIMATGHYCGTLDTTEDKPPF